MAPWAKLPLFVVPTGIPTVPLAIQLCAYGLGGQRKLAQVLGILKEHRRPRRSPGSQFQIGSALATVAVGGVN